MNSQKDSASEDQDILDRIMELSTAIGEDFGASYREVTENNSSYARRSFVRTFGSVLEAMTTILKGLCLSESDNDLSRLSPAESAVLKEEAYILKPNGKTDSRTQFFPVLDNFKFSVLTLAKLKGFPVDLACDCKGHASAKLAIQIRNRITHPKDISDLEISDSEIKSIMMADTWVQYLTNTSILGVIDSLVKENLALLRAAEAEGGQPTRSAEEIKSGPEIEEIRERTRSAGIACGALRR